MAQTYARTSDGPPKTYVLDLTAADDDVDFTDVSAAVFKVKSPGVNGTTSTWAATITTQTTSTIRLSYMYADNQFPTPGVYFIYALLTVTGGTLASEPRALHVRDAFEVSIGS